MEDIAEMAGVSKMTVSRALRVDAPVSKATRERIQAVIDEIGYVPDQMAASFSLRRSGFIAVLIPSVDNSNFANTLRGVADVLDTEGLQVLLGDTEYRAEKEEDLIATMLKRRPEGIIVTGGSHTKRGRKLLASAGIPVIEMWDTPDQPIDDAIGFSHANASREMVVHLISKGYQNIGFVGGATGRDTRGADRRRGFEAALKEFGLPGGRIVTFGDPPITVNQGGQALVRMVEQWPEIEAVICVSDLSALGAIMEAHRRGWKVPEQIAVAGFGDFEIARYCYPSITTVSADWRKLGQQAGRQILTKIAAHRAGESISPTTILVDFEILVREST